MKMSGDCAGVPAVLFGWSTDCAEYPEVSQEYLLHFRLFLKYNSPHFQAKRPIKQQIDDFEQHQKAKNNTEEYVYEIVQKVRVIAEYCEWNNALQIRESDVEGFLLHLRKELGRSIQTPNNYLRAIKCFVHWLKRNKRITSNPLEGMKMLNASTDRRHDRRPLEDEEFARGIAFTSFDHPFMFRRQGSVPLMAFGEMVSDGNRKAIAHSLHMHHALVDGQHAAKYFWRMQERLGEM